MKPPETLSEKSKAVFKDIERLSNRELSTAEYSLIEALCREIDLYNRAVMEIESGGFTNEHNQVAPAVTVRNQAANNIRQLYKQVADFVEHEAPESKLRSVKNF